MGSEIWLPVVGHFDPTPLGISELWKGLGMEGLIFPSDISWQNIYKCLEHVPEVKSRVRYMMRVAEFF